ncbi:hypothetical protein CEXT_241441 [Caerostris extrusa]|uniref:Secreted protein n=1 Tax=Caerostris extrusa TaxID=172846 RepID=A0AAV4TME5_CAEEX|nr:hypothetical protein CEXT_241441 [Caerostris extrusa]
MGPFVTILIWFLPSLFPESLGGTVVESNKQEKKKLMKIKRAICDDHPKSLDLSKIAGSGVSCCMYRSVKRHISQEKIGKKENSLSTKEGKKKKS